MEDHGTTDSAQADVRRRLYSPIAATDYRVVHILPGRFKDEIQCILETRPSRLKTRYEALSYQWGDESNTKPIRIARLHSSFPSVSSTRFWPEGVMGALTRTFRFLRAAANRHADALHTLGWAAGAVFLYRMLSSVSFELPRWMPRLVPPKIYLALWCILCGTIPSYLVIGACKLVAEVVETKPWLAFYGFHISRSQEESPRFDTLQVTSNLSLALRYLRREKVARTFWIDALCINQEDEDEKIVQIQRMDWIYANAYSMVVWIGGYHGLEEPDRCAGSQEADCEHQRQIRAAFHHIWARSGWRNTFRWYLNRDEESEFRKARAGLCEIARRGWWERLWVIQEAALATAPIQIQCGSSTFDFKDFGSGHYSLMLKHNKDRELQDVFRPSDHMLATIREFHYSRFQDRAGALAQTLSKGMMKFMDVLYRDKDHGEPGFNQQPFAQRLHRVLLRTSGRYRCHDDRDRLYAVLGIAGGTKTGKSTTMANFIEGISSFTTSMVIGQYMDHRWPWATASIRARVTMIAIAMASAQWGVFYEEKARHWNFNRPAYEVADYRKVIDAVVSGSEGRRSNRVEFFTNLAGYLARETKTLSFLDVANCGEDQDEDMPSWVPNWSRELSKPAYDFAIRAKQAEAPSETFRIFEGKGAKMLWLFGRSKGRVRILGKPDLDRMRSSPWHGAFEKGLALTSDEKAVVATSLETLHSFMQEPYSEMLAESGRKIIPQILEIITHCLEIGFARLEEAGATLVYSYDLAARDIGYLRAVCPKPATLDWAIEQAAKRVPRDLLRDRELARHQKAVDPQTGELVGYARWKLPADRASAGDRHPIWAEARTVEAEISPEEQRRIDEVASESMLAQWPERLEARNNEIRQRIMAKQPYLELDYLGVHPKHQRKGIATTLVKSGLQVAQDLGLDVFLQASDVGRLVYEKLGFKLIDENIEDDSEFGGPGRYVTYFMVWDHRQNVRGEGKQGAWEIGAAAWKWFGLGVPNWGN
ncbi:hypothetical protein GQ53DRAFT_847095 [Thozetella sp. PMI_491]|nr:hypothetical protein GQ53DRAFT_847095 [Thozetella sp. PMI_491]